MMRFLGFVFLIALAVGAWGWHKGWFSGAMQDHGDSTDFTFKVDKAKLARDLQDFESAAQSALDKIRQKIEELKNSAKQASAEAKPKIEQEIQELEKRRDAAADSLKDLKDASAEKAAELKKKIDEALQPEKKDGGGK